jgi:transglutaminase-like putative cysteine protease
VKESAPAAARLPVPDRMHLHLLHRTTFVYDGLARDSFNEVRLRPMDNDLQSCRRFTLRIQPEAPTREYVDFHGNTTHYFSVANPHSELTVEAESEVETTPNAARPPPPQGDLLLPMSPGEAEMQAEYLQASHYVALTEELERECRVALAAGRGSAWDEFHRLGRHVRRTFTYKPEATGVHTLASDALRLRAGVCQDFAHVLIGLSRCAGIPARYVSGYFLNRNRQPGEAEASHAWVEGWMPGLGWTAFDPTHERPADERYIQVAMGRDYADIRPIAGTYRGSSTRELRVEVEVRETAAALAAR